MKSTSRVNTLQAQCVSHALQEGKQIVGVDEVGRGALAGPIVACAFQFSQETFFPKGVRDSKLLSCTQREKIAKDLWRRNAHAIGWAFASVEEIERLNPLQASLLAMRRAVLSLCLPSQVEIYVDGLFTLNLSYPTTALVGGDGYLCGISAASIIAKVLRDHFMQTVALAYPYYGFSTHKGYGVFKHFENLAAFGPCHWHRSNFLKKFYAKNHPHFDPCVQRVWDAYHARTYESTVLD